MSEYYNRNREYSEAIAAGEAALNSLYAARNHLNSARRWGLLDIFGGNFVTGMIKHNAVNEARHYINDASARLNVFYNELDDIQNLPALNIDISDFLTLADFVFDGLVADILVQQKIAQAKLRIEEVIPQLEDALTTLRRNM